MWREEVAKLAVELGLFGPEGEMPWTNPDGDRFMQWDGTVLTPMYKSKSGRKKDKKTGKMKKVRYDRDAKLHTIGGGGKAFGVKHGIVSARTDRDRIFLDWEHVPDKGEGGEAGMGMRCFGRLAPLLPGAQGVNSDKVMRGTHIDQAMRELGWLIVTGVHDVKDKDGNPIDWHIEDLPVKRADGTEDTISIYAREGAAGIRELDETGNWVLSRSNSSREDVGDAPATTGSTTTSSRPPSTSTNRCVFACTATPRTPAAG